MSLLTLLGAPASPPRATTGAMPPDADSGSGFDLAMQGALATTNEGALPTSARDEGDSQNPDAHPDTAEDANTPAGTHPAVDQLHGLGAHIPAIPSGDASDAGADDTSAGQPALEHPGSTPSSRTEEPATRGLAPEADGRPASVETTEIEPLTQVGRATAETRSTAAAPHATTAQDPRRTRAATTATAGSVPTQAAGASVDTAPAVGSAVTVGAAPGVGTAPAAANASPAAAPDHPVSPSGAVQTSAAAPGPAPDLVPEAAPRQSATDTAHIATASAPAGTPTPVSATAAATPAATPSPATPSASPQDFTAQLSRPIADLRAAGPGTHTISITITPENLGPVTVRAHIDGDGMRIELFAPNDAGRDAVRAVLTDLRRDLAGLSATGSSTLELADRDRPDESAPRSTDGDDPRRDHRGDPAHGRTTDRHHGAGVPHESSPGATSEPPGQRAGIDVFA